MKTLLLYVLICANSFGAFISTSDLQKSVVGDSGTTTYAKKTDCEKLEGETCYGFSSNLDLSAVKLENGKVVKDTALKLAKANDKAAKEMVIQNKIQANKNRMERLKSVNIDSMNSIQDMKQTLKDLVDTLTK